MKADADVGFAAHAPSPRSTSCEAAHLRFVDAHAVGKQRREEESCSCKNRDEGYGGRLRRAEGIGKPGGIGKVSGLEREVVDFERWRKAAQS